VTSVTTCLLIVSICRLSMFTRCWLCTPFASSAAGRVSSSTRALALVPVPIIASIFGGLPCQLPPRAMPSFGCVRFGYRKCAVFLQFRIGCHKLPIVAVQHQRPSVPRAARLCLHCDMGALGDEYHVLFECPATRAARAPFAHLFPPGCVMLEFMHHADTRAVARCILACLRVYDQPPLD